MRLINKSILFLLLYFICTNDALAIFNKNIEIANSMPRFREDYENYGKMYIGGIFSWQKGYLGDSRSLGLNEEYNKSMYNVERNYAEKISHQSTEFKNHTGTHSGGAILFGYIPMDPYFSMFRHELEIGNDSHSGIFNHVTANNTYCVEDTDCYTGLKYNLTQRHLLYNLYFQPPSKMPLNYFLGGGIGFALTDIELEGTKDKTTASNITSSSDAFSKMFTLFVGFNYDISDQIVMQFKIKGTVVKAPTQRLKSGSLENIEYSGDARYKPGGDMLKIIGIDIGILFGL